MILRQTKSEATSRQSSLKFQDFPAGKAGLQALSPRIAKCDSALFAGKNKGSTVFAGKNGKEQSLPERMRCYAPYGKIGERAFCEKINRHFVRQQAQFEGTRYFLEWPVING